MLSEGGWHLGSTAGWGICRSLTPIQGQVPVGPSSERGGQLQRPVLLGGRSALLWSACSKPLSCR